MKELELIKTDLGKIPVMIDVKNKNTLFIGKLLYEDHNIHIETPTRESCLLGLKNAFELEMHFWVRSELSGIEFEYVSKFVQ